MTPQLKLTKRPNRTAEAKALAEIQREQSEWVGALNQPFKPYTGSTTPLADKVSETLERATYRVIVDAPVPRWQRILRKIWG